MLKHPALLFLTPYLIPLLAFAKPPVLPKATAPILVPINTQFVDSDGLTYVLSGTLTKQLLSVTPPPPPPPVTVSLAYLTMSPSAVIAGQSAAVNVILTGPVPVGQIANVLLTSADPGVQVPGLLSIPEGKGNGSAPIVTTIGVRTEKLVDIRATFNGKSAGANLRVLPDGVTPPPVPGVGEPLVSTYLNGDGSPLVGPVKYGQELLIIGSGFGTTPGRSYWQGGSIVILGWSDTQIRVKLPVPLFTGPTQFSIWRPDGMWCEFGVPLDGPGRVPGAKRR